MKQLVARNLKRRPGITIFSRDMHEITELLTAALDAKHGYTSGHSDRVARIGSQIAESLGFSEKECEFVHIAGHLHDIGKIGIPDIILQKPGRLTPEEFAIIKTHPKTGCDILSKAQGFSIVARAVLHHHERWDGKGYPGGLAGRAIPLVSRIIAVADAYDAITTHRPYRSFLSDREAAAEIVRCTGTQFDPFVVEAFERWMAGRPE